MGPKHITAQELHEIHLRFNHAAPARLQHLFKNRKIQTPANKVSYIACLKSKMKRAPHKRSKNQYMPDEDMCSDITGPVTKATKSQPLHSVMKIMDVASRYVRAIPIDSKPGVVTSENIRRTIEDNIGIHGKSPKMIVTDNAREYVLGETKKLLDTYGIELNPTIPHNPEENGIAESVNATIKACVRAALAIAELPEHFWPYAVADVVDKYII